MDRAILWKKARMTKDMKIDDELAAINDKIVSIYVINYFIYSVLKSTLQHSFVEYLFVIGSSTGTKE